MKQSWRLLYSVLFLSVLLHANTGWSAACCGGGFAAPALISGDDRAQLTTSYSNTEVVIDSVDSKGVWREWNDHQRVQTFRIEGAHLISDRWQVGATLPIVERSLQDQNFSGFGDILGALAYEYLTDWDYNPYRPKGIGYLQVTLPTGKSRAESDANGMDSLGNGFAAVGIGTLLTKIVGRWDTFASFELRRSFNKHVANSQFNATLKPGFGGNLGIGGGYNTASWRFGGSITWTYEDPVEIQGTSDLRWSFERYATAVVALSYLVNDAWAGTLSYSDQTVFGDPVNTSLGRSVAIQIQRRWAR